MPTNDTLKYWLTNLLGKYKVIMTKVQYGRTSWELMNWKQ